MAKPEAQFEAVGKSTEPKGDSHPFAGTLDDTYGPGARAQQRQERTIPGVPQNFVQTNMISQREYMHVESGRNPQTGEPDGKAMASSETLLRAESKMVYSALNGGKHSEMKDAALERLGVDATGKVLDPNDTTKSVNLKDPESVYQRYLAVEAKREHITSTNPKDIENARIRDLYKHRNNTPEIRD
ncbi:MAG TPA: hypothetical protein V6C76_03615 [Drouetiella sp.]